MAKEIPNGHLIAVSPTTFNTILWRGLVETEEGYYVSHWSPFDDEKQGFEFFAKGRELVADLEGEEMLESLQWFSRGHWVAREGEDGKVILIDMRCSGVRDQVSGMVLRMFQWHLQRNELGEVVAPLMRPKGVDFRKAFSLIWERIWGETDTWNEIKPF